MRYLLMLVLILMWTIIACDKEDAPAPEFSIEGYWQVTGDFNFKSVATNSTADLYHLFRGENNFYSYSFLKTDNFSNLALRPRADSIRALYRIEGKKLLIPNSAPTVSNNIPPGELVNQTNDELTFHRNVVVRRSLLNGEIQERRTDTLRYTKVTDATKVAYFDNYLKNYHK